MCDIYSAFCIQLKTKLQLTSHDYTFKDFVRIMLEIVIVIIVKVNTVKRC